MEPTAIVPAVDQRRVVWVPDAYGPGMVPVPYDHAPPLPERTPPRDLAAPGWDPVAQRLLAGGAGTGAAAAGIGWGLGQVAAGMTSGAAVWILAALLVAKLGRRSGTGGGDTYVITNHNRWWGKSTTRT